MAHTIVIRCYKPGDEFYCKELLKDSVMSSMNATFVGTLFKEIIFQVVILLSAVMFIFFGLPITVCALVIPGVVVLVYVGTYLEFVSKAAEVDKEVFNIPRVYMSNAFSCFWVAEAFEPYLKTNHPKDVSYKIMTEEQFCNSNIDVSSCRKKIIGTVALSKSHRLDKGAWIKRLCVHKQYRRRGIASSLLNVAIQFAIDQGYSCTNVLASEYTEGGRELCIKKGFELQQMYYKPVLGSLLTILMYELTYQIKPDNNDYIPLFDIRSLNYKLH